MTKLILAPTVLTLVSEDAEGLLARLRQGALVLLDAEGPFAGRELMQLENVLAHAVFRDLRTDPENAVQRELEMRAWPMMQSSIGMRNPFLQGIDWAETDLVGLIERHVEERARADAMSLEEAVTMLRDHTIELSVLYPALGLSFGYIGDCDLGCGPADDDRSWKVFTKLATPGSSCSDVSWGGRPSGHLGRLAVEAAKSLESWCAATEKRLRKGEIRTLVRAAA